jgi:hypothetical protein
MTDHAVTAIIAILTGAIGLAVIATLVSNQANTSNVIKAGGSAFSQILTAATGPVTGGGGLGSSLNNSLSNIVP